MTKLKKVQRNSQIKTIGHLTYGNGVTNLVVCRAFVCVGAQTTPHMAWCDPPCRQLLEGSRDAPSSRTERSNT